MFLLALSFAALAAFPSIPSSPLWTLPIPAPGAANWIAPVELGDAPDVQRVTFTLPVGASVEATWAAWTQALTAAGWVALTRNDDPQGARGTFERGELRAFLELWPTPASSPEAPATAAAMGRATLGKPHAGPPRESKCLPVPTASFVWMVHARGIDQHGELHQNDIRHLRQTQTTIDVDGDFIPDVWVPLVDPKTTHCPEDVRWQIWRVRPDPAFPRDAKNEGLCGYPIGASGPGYLTADAWKAPFGPGGLRDLVTERRTSALGNEMIPNLTTTTTTARFDGTRYVPGPPSERSGRCHHCATWHCNILK